MQKPQVIVISGVTASGKTTLINELHEEIADSAVISFDDYDADALPSSPPLDTPLEEAVNQYDISLLMDDFFRKRRIFSTILIDFPFGNRHHALAPYIDKTVYLQTPLDISFARLLLRDYADKAKEEILDWCRDYLKSARATFADHQRYISASADMILDGALPLEEQSRKVRDLIDLNK